MKKDKPSLQSLGGKARAAKFTPKQRQDQARALVRAREEKRTREREHLEHCPLWRQERKLPPFEQEEQERLDELRDQGN